MHRLAITAASLIAATALIGGCEPFEEPHLTLHALCKSGDATPERIQEFLDLRADVNAKDEDGDTPLHWAAFNESPEVVATLIKAGADVNARDEGGHTPLYMAVGPNQSHEVVTTLIKAGADVNAKNEEGDTPLDRAVFGDSGGPKNAEVLRAAGGKRGRDLP